jgi:hypothetical protein
MAFQNLGATGATLNWIYSDGSVVSATGVLLAAGLGEKDFSFISKRIEGQFIFAAGPNVITVNLHAFDAGTGCEVRGTSEFAAS